MERFSMDTMIIFVFVSVCVLKTTSQAPCHLRDLTADCDMVPNLNIPSAVTGKVTLTQLVNQKSCRYGDLNVDVFVSDFPNTQTTSSSSEHGFHVYRDGDLSRGCESLGPHYNPLGSPHGAPWMPWNRRHVGDWGNVRRRLDGTIRASFSDSLARLYGQYSIFGRGLAISQYPDDFGLGGGEQSLIDGNSGRRIACCIIRRP